jgi:hypothetical protein
MHNMLYPICSFEGSGVYASSITSQFRVAGKIRSASGEVSAFQGALFLRRYGCCFHSATYLTQTILSWTNDRVQQDRSRNNTGGAF